MPVPLLGQGLAEGIDSIPYLLPILKQLRTWAPILAAIWVLKWFFNGTSNASERNMHGKVVMVTGGTSGVGASLVRELASRGAQIVLLTQHSLIDPFIVDYVEDLRQETSNELITAEQVDLASLHSIRGFATKWIDNAPPRRLDMVVLCANTITPSGGEIKSTDEGVETNWQVNYLANFHLLSILSPALRAQPPDRDVRVLFGTCSSYVGGDLLHITQPAETPKSSKKAANGKPASPPATTSPTKFSPGNAYATSKLALTTFALAFQKHLSTYKRPDNFPMNTKVLLVDPGICRTPGTRRWLCFGSLFGLLLYLLFYPLWWLVLKSPEMGAQSFLYAAMEERFGRIVAEPEGKGGNGGNDTLMSDAGAEKGGWLIKECRVRPYGREDVDDEDAQRKLWEYSEKMIEEAEKRGIAHRTKAKREYEERKEELHAEKEIKDYKEKVGKKVGQKKEGSRRSRKAAAD